MTKERMREIQSRRAAYQQKKTEETKARIAQFLSDQERAVLMNGTGFVVVPEEERLLQRIDAYPYLIQ